MPFHSGFGGTREQSSETDEDTDQADEVKNVVNLG